MGALINISIDLNKIDKSKIVTGKSGGKYYNLTLSVNDTPDNYGQNVAVFDTQTQNERQAKEKKTYLGNGKVFWNDGNIVNAVQSNNQNTSQPQNKQADFSDMDDDLPF